MEKLGDSALLKQFFFIYLSSFKKNNMNDFLVPANPGARLPLVDFKLSGDFRIEGLSVSEHPIQFYEPVFEWLENFKKTNPPAITLTMKLEYFNTSSSKIFFNMFKALDPFQKNGTNVKIIWKYDKSDEDMSQSGKDYKSIVKVPFELEEI
jgi:hypothetical protein